MMENSERRAPVQSEKWKRDKSHKPNGTIAWWEHARAWEAYNERFPGQSAERMAERGGFSWGELKMFLGHEPTTWLPQGYGG
jgi:hypothetical protein